MKNRNRGYFIAIEGIDGSGKSSLVKSIISSHYFRNEDLVVINKKLCLQEPSARARLEKLRQTLWEEQTVENRNELADLYWLSLAIAWFSLIDQLVVKPAIGAGKLILADSWYHKILARFALKDEKISSLAHQASSLLTEPDTIVLLDVTPSIAAERKDVFGYSESGNFDGLQGCNKLNFVNYQSRVRSSYLTLANRGNWKILSQEDASPAAVVQIFARNTVERSQ